MPNSSNLDVIKQHVEACLNVAFEKLDVATLLRNAKKYPSAITSYIESYEEIGQALFLTDKISGNEEISENDLNRHIIPASHTKKILTHWVTRREQLIKNLNMDFEKLQKSEIGELFRVTGTKKDVLEKIKGRIIIFSNLHKLRQAFDYSHEMNGQIVNCNYGEKSLESLCQLLEFECLTSYYVVQQWLEYNATAPPDNVDDQIKKITTLPATMKLKKLAEIYATDTNKKLINQGLKFVGSF